MTFFCILAGLLAVCAAVTPFLPARPLHLIDLPSHFALQGAIGSALMVFFFNFLAVFTANMDILPSVTLCVVALIINMRVLRPYMRIRRGANAGDRLKILQANLLKTNKEPALLQKLAEAENPDIIACCEVSTPMAEMLRGLEKTWPHQRLVLDESGYGVAALSKYPFDTVEDMRLPGSRATAIAFKVKNISFVALHAVTPVANIAARDTEFRALAERFAGVTPLVLMGDFNATPWCPALKRLCAALRLRNARLGLGLVLTWPLWLPPFLRLPIDHVLVSQGIRVDSFTTGTPTGSDHLPTITVITP